MTSISACLVVRNEERVIERCLSSLAGVVDEIILVHDGACADRTLEIAERFGARITVAEFRGNQEPHRPLAYELARGEWVLRIDADEFLSPELRDALPGLTEQPDVNGWELLWRISDGTRYLTRGGPYKLALSRRSEMRCLGVPHSLTGVRGRVERRDLSLEHQPVGGSYNRSSAARKWRRWARVSAGCYLSDWATLEKFGYDDDQEGWPRWRPWANRLSPLLFAPYGVAHFWLALWRLRGVKPARQWIWIAAYHGAYAGLAQAYVAKLRYLEHHPDRARAAPRTSGEQPATRESFTSGM